MRRQANRRHENTDGELRGAGLPAPQRGEAATGWSAGRFSAGRGAGVFERGGIVGNIGGAGLDPTIQRPGQAF